VHVTREGGVPVARMKGEVDLGCVGVLRAALEEAVAPGDRGLVIDLGGVEYLDSAGMHLLHDLARVLLRRGQRVRVVAPRDPGVTRALELIGLGDSIGLDATVAEARDALA
jgi:anti-anti-sigma factor